MKFEPVGSAEGAVAGEVWDGREITTWDVRSFAHPLRIVLDPLPDFRPATCETVGLGIPGQFHSRRPPALDSFLLGRSPDDATDSGTRVEVCFFI